MKSEMIESKVLLFNSYEIKKIELNVIPPSQFIPEDQNNKVIMDTQFSKKIIKFNDTEFSVNLGVKISGPDSEQKKVIDLKVCMEGHFKIIGNLPSDKEFENNSNINAVSILFPYLRMAVSTISMLSNHGQIDLPPMNIIRWFELEK